MIFCPRLALRTPENAKFTLHFCPLLRPKNAGVRSHFSFSPPPQLALGTPR